jgi:predicted transcriptional regulator
MLVVETVAGIRRDHRVHGKSIQAIARERGMSRNTVRKVLCGEATAVHCVRAAQPLPRLGPYRERLEELLAANEGWAQPSSRWPRISPTPSSPTPPSTSPW